MRLYTGYCHSLHSVKAAEKPYPTQFTEEAKPNLNSVHYLTTTKYWWSTILAYGRAFYISILYGRFPGLFWFRHEFLTKSSLLPLLLLTSHIYWSPVGKLFIKPPRGAKINARKWWWERTPNWSTSLDFLSIQVLKVHVVNKTFTICLLPPPPPPTLKALFLTSLSSSIVLRETENSTLTPAQP